MRDHTYFVYIMASRSRTLYIGFTSDLRVRVQQHREGTFEGFTSRYDCHRLVYYESFGYVHHAIAREKQLKRWSRAKKIILVELTNPTWEDLSEEWGKPTAPWKEPANPSNTD